MNRKEYVYFSDFIWKTYENLTIHTNDKGLEFLQRKPIDDFIQELRMMILKYVDRG